VVRSIAPRQKGDEYQALIYWFHLCQLRTNDYVETVCIEHDQVSFVDDVVVTYKEPQLDKLTGYRYSCAFFQCKYHVTQKGSFNHKSLIDPDFIGTQESMLKRLYNAYLKLSKEYNDSFLLYIVSSWVWDPSDEIARHISDEHIRDSFFSGGLKSKTGEICKTFADHLSIDEQELPFFIRHLRFQLGKTLTGLVKELEPLLKLASLKPIDTTRTSYTYDDLAWKLYAQGRNCFDRKSFERMVYEEHLVVEPSPDYSEISICSRKEHARRPSDIQAAHLDISNIFYKRFPNEESFWNKEIPERVSFFLRSEKVESLKQPIRLFFDCHLSIAFFTGFLIDPKYGIQIIPVQKSMATGYDEWPVPKSQKNGLWEMNIAKKIETEVVVGISITHPISNHLLPYLKTQNLDTFTFIELQPIEGVGPLVIRNGEHAWQLAFELRNILDNALSSDCTKLHFFYAGPVAFAYIMGNAIRYITKNIQLYEHDFEGTTEFRYYPSIQLPIEETKLA